MTPQQRWYERNRDRLVQPGAVRRSRADVPLRRFWDLYRHNAKQRGVQWDLSFEQFAALTKQPCVYCGSPPMHEFRHRARDKASYVCNGVDRLDNTQGYCPGNVAACCKICNLAKRDMPLSAFTSWSMRLAAHQQRLGLL